MPKPRTLTLGPDVLAFVILRTGGPELAQVAGEGALVADVEASPHADRRQVAAYLRYIARELDNQAAMLADTEAALEARR